MARFVIDGPTKLDGDVKISGAKNEALKLIPFALVLKNPINLENTPNILDIKRQLEIFESMGGKCSLDKHKLFLDGTNVSKARLASGLARRLRASIVFIGPLLARFGKVTFPLPGGCLIGARSIETHTDAFKQLGANIIEKNLLLTIELPSIQKTHVILKEKSVTATENLIMYCSAVEETITIENCAVEPEIVHLCQLAVEAGAKIDGIGTNTLKISGSKSLSLKKATIIADRIEAATFVIAFLVTGGTGTVSPYPKDQLESFNDLLLEVGANVKFEKDKAIISKANELKGFSITTKPYPGFPTDLQSPVSLLAAIANGKSQINETMYENRLAYLKFLEKMGLNVEIIDNHKAQITGPTIFKATDIDSLDLRSGITMLIAGLMASGKTTVNNCQIIDRGYENIEQKFNLLGAKIVRLR